MFSRHALRLPLAGLFAASVLALAACGGGGGDDAPPEPGDQAVAKVQERTIWASDVKREAVAQGLIGEGEPLDVTSALFRRVLDEVIDQKLLAHEAERRGLDNSPLAERRLHILESLVLDPSRRLVLVQIDGEERLLLLGEGSFVSVTPSIPAEAQP